jgi:ribosomal protein S18 acetylase RimI-like enzyme
MENDVVTIRLAEKQDIPVVVELNHALFQEDAGQRDSTMNLNWAREHGFEYFSGYFDLDKCVIFLAETTGQVVGYLAGYIQPPNDYRMIISAELESMFVERSYRTQGVGKRLAREFTTWSKEKGAGRVTVTAYSANKNAIAFYERLGFVPKYTTLELRID